MRNNFPQIMKWILASEGGYVDNPRDPGGATNLGVTIAVLRAWRNRPVSRQEVRSLSVAEAMLIYDANYWKHIFGDGLPSGVDYAMMDAAVNSGVSRSIKWLQQVLKVPQTGHIDTLTVAAVARVTDKVKLVKSYNAARLGFMQSLRIWSTFGKGWGIRVRQVTSRSIILATHVAPAAAHIISHH